MRCYVFCREILGMFQKFRERFNGTPARPQKKSARMYRSMKSVVLTSPENVSHLKRKQPKCEDAQNKKEKIIKKRHQSPKKKAAKRKKPKRAACFNKEIMIVVGLRCGYLHDLKAEITSQIDQEQLHQVQQVPQTVPFKVRLHGTKLFHVPKLRLRSLY